MLDVYVYKPSKDWAFCGGLLILGVRLGTLPPHRLPDPEGGDQKLLREGEKVREGEDTWELVTKFTSPDAPEGVIAWDYNYA